MITRLSIQHFRSIGNIDLDLGDVNVLVGPNGVGKSNTLDAISFVRDSLRYGLDQAITDRQGIQTIRQWSPTRPYDITISIQVAEANQGHGSFEFTLASSGGTSYVIKREIGTWSEVRRYRTRDRRTATGYRVQREEINSSYERQQNGKVVTTDLISGETSEYRIEDVDDLFLASRYLRKFVPLRLMLVDFETYSIFPNTLRQPEKQSGELYLQTHGENLASVLRRMRKKKRLVSINEIVESLRTALPYLSNITVQSIAGLLTPQFLVKEDKKIKPHYFHVNQMSDGTLRILGLLVALYQDPRPSTIALEEPELTIHPGVLRMISDSIKEVSEESQVIITTHSPDLIDHFDPNQLISVELEKGKTCAVPLNAKQVKAVKERLFSLSELMVSEGLHG